MHGLARRYPGYGWERNVGYGTAEHGEAIRRLGITAHHRRSFAPVRLAISAPADFFALLDAGALSETDQPAHRLN
jgi:ribonuclease HII